jgi:hypothetical protein
MQNTAKMGNVCRIFFVRLTVLMFAAGFMAFGDILYIQLFGTRVHDTVMSFSTRFYFFFPLF